MAQNPIYNFQIGQVVYVERDYEKKSLYKSHIINIFDDVYSNGDEVKIIVTRYYVPFKQCWFYKTYREIELSSLAYWMCQEYFDKAPAEMKKAMSSYEVKSVWGYINGIPQDIPQKDWKIKKFKINK